MKLAIKKVAIWLAVIVGLCYVACIDGTFHFDDSHSVESNLAIRSMANIPSFWTDTRTSSFIPENRVYRPLVYTFYSVCWWVGGGKTTPFHIMKMLMHWMVCLALFLIWRRLWSEPGWFPLKSIKIKIPMISQVFVLTPEWTAFFLAALFAVHPAGSECVDYISATTSLQCAAFYVWAFYFYLEYRDTKVAKKLIYSLLLYFLSVASKEEGITLPAMVLVTELFLLKSPWKQRIADSIRMASSFVVMGFLLAFWIYVMHPTEGNESRGYVTSFQYFITQWRAYLWYMRLWFWPWDFNADNASLVFTNSITEPLAIQSLIGNLLVVVFALTQLKNVPALLYGVIWFYVTISPASSVVVLAEAINEHRMYLAYIGFVGGTFIFLLYAAEAFFQSELRTKALGWAYLAVFIGLVIGTQERNRVWLNDENLWADTVDKNPTSGRALNNLALVHMAKGQHKQALELLDKCEKNWGTYMYCSLNKSIAYQSQATIEEKAGKKEEAQKNLVESEKSLQRAYQLHPRSVHVNFHIGRFYEETKKDYLKATEYYKTAIQLTGGRHPAAEIHLANCYTGLKRPNEARTALMTALELEPDNQAALFELARLEFSVGRFDEAINIYHKLIERNPNHLQAWYNLGVVQISKKDLTTARRAFERTVEIDPNSVDGWFNLAFVAESMGDGMMAVRAAQQLVTLSPNRPDFQSRLRDLQKKFKIGQS